MQAGVLIGHRGPGDDIDEARVVLNSQPKSHNCGKPQCYWRRRPSTIAGFAVKLPSRCRAFSNQAPHRPLILQGVAGQGLSHARIARDQIEVLHLKGARQAH